MRRGRLPLARASGHELVASDVVQAEPAPRLYRPHSARHNAADTAAGHAALCGCPPKAEFGLAQARLRLSV